MDTRRSRFLFPVSWLAAVAIAGLLSMHGLDPAILGVDQAASQGVDDSEMADRDAHAAIGLCVFTIAALLGLAAASSTTERRRIRTSPTRYAAAGANLSVIAPGGRQRLADLCVLRL